MTNAWRAAGLTYIQYSNICARVVRQSLKANLRSDAAKRNETHVKFTPWANGKPARRVTEEA
ncbi:PREDICTED: ATP synthase subunit epsilon, mitochondrial [Bactrocera latifrons]|uniref:ATP synthase subunit epsilon, mitochondrial n=1 Tax=Bactrocera latifrons TaxID=174628 RepID=UPI0008DC8CA9|nr:PREDICTED: ATP synthase subunit epsilon, mitochondrial [Bactrocera latifrons]